MNSNRVNSNDGKTITGASTSLEAEERCLPAIQNVTGDDYISFETISFKAYLAWLNSAELENPDITHRMNAADAAALFIAAVKTFGAKQRLGHLRLNPAAGVALQLVDAATKVAASRATVLNHVVSPSTPGTGRKPSGSRQKTPSSKRQKLSARSKKTASSKGDTSTVSPKAATKPAKVTKDPRTKILSKALRSFRGSGVQAIIAKEQGLTEDTLTQRIKALTDADIAKFRGDGRPALAYTGIFDNIEKWSDEDMADQWLNSTRDRRMGVKQGIRQLGLPLPDRMYATVTGLPNQKQAASLFSEEIKRFFRKLGASDLILRFTQEMPYASQVDIIDIHNALVSGDTAKVFWNVIGKSGPTSNPIEVVYTIKVGSSKYRMSGYLGLTSGKEEGKYTICLYPTRPDQPLSLSYASITKGVSSATPINKSGSGV